MLLDDTAMQPRFLTQDGGPNRFIRVDKKKWDYHLLRSERWEGVIGCSGFCLLCILSLFIFYSFYLYGIPFFILLMGAIYWKTHSTRKHKYLLQHSQFTFCLLSYKIVRYGDTNYEIFEFDQLSKIRHTTYGTHFEKNIQWWEWLDPSIYKTSNPRLLILPEVADGYWEIKAYLNGQVMPSIAPSTPS